VVCLSACTPGEEDLYWESETQTWRGAQCEPGEECLSARLTLPSFPDLEPELQDQIDAWIAYDTLIAPGATGMPEDMMEDFIHDMDFYDQSLYESPRTHGWYARMDVQVSLAQPPLLGLVRSVEDFAGGAHGLERIDFLIIDLEYQELLSLEDLVAPRDWETLRLVAEAEFLEEHGSLDQFWFPNKELSLPRSERGVGISVDGLELSWGLYEIACYGYGVPRLTLPWEDVEHLIREGGPASFL
jgi:hypothetical protein